MLRRVEGGLSLSEILSCTEAEMCPKKCTNAGRQLEEEKVGLLRVEGALSCGAEIRGEPRQPGPGLLKAPTTSEQL